MWSTEVRTSTEIVMCLEPVHVQSSVFFRNACHEGLDVELHGSQGGSLRTRQKRTEKRLDESRVLACVRPAAEVGQEVR